MNNSYFSFTNDLSFNKSRNKKIHYILNISSFILIVIFGMTNFIYGLKNSLFLEANIIINKGINTLIPWIIISIISILSLLIIGILNYLLKCNDKNSINKFNANWIKTIVFVSFFAFVISFLMVIFPSQFNEFIGNILVVTNAFLLVNILSVWFVLMNNTNQEILVKTNVVKYYKIDSIVRQIFIFLTAVILFTMLFIEIISQSGNFSYFLFYAILFIPIVLLVVFWITQIIYAFIVLRKTTPQKPWIVLLTIGFYNPVLK
ncbi:Uncharacterised protein [Metamycoplasma cloacale]|uniref:Uncharacterized protein n=2 Tax=Metamycoplasma cloacale TaxID=92401 RepID=A0A2Z4LLT9_9BACT|nr:hypothetical protein DK849_01220 [Metamycoplasma cloacale]VEU79493.1 Uncharacterised protein [Metamycoplasma cloacale]